MYKPVERTLDQEGKQKQLRAGGRRIGRKCDDRFSGATRHRAHFAHTRSKQRTDDKLGSFRQALLRRRARPLGGRTIVLDKQGNIVVASFRPSQFGGIAQGGADDAWSRRLSYREDERHARRAGAELVGLVRRGVPRPGEGGPPPPRSRSDFAPPGTAAPAKWVQHPPPARHARASRSPSRRPQA